MAVTLVPPGRSDSSAIQFEVRDEARLECGAEARRYLECGAEARRYPIEAIGIVCAPSHRFGSQRSGDITVDRILAENQFADCGLKIADRGLGSIFVWFVCFVVLLADCESQSAAMGSPPIRKR